MRGQVYKIISGFYDIHFANQLHRVRGAGRLRTQAVRPIVGDFVEFEQGKFVTAIYPRTNELYRPKVANVDQVAIVVALQDPRYSSLLLNKFLAIVEFQNIKPLIIFTKIDLAPSPHSQEYRRDGYDVYEVNNFDMGTIHHLQNAFKHKLTVFAGQTGVGKSSIITNITKIARATQPISRSLGRGKHTTRVVEILTSPQGRFIDTPGFSALGMTMSPQQLAQAYQDFSRNGVYCKFKDCVHAHEAECQIKMMVNNHQISVTRYNDYLRLLRGLAHG